MPANRCPACGYEVEIRVLAGLGPREVLALRPKILHTCQAKGATKGDPELARRTTRERPALLRRVPARDLRIIARANTAANR